MGPKKRLPPENDEALSLQLAREIAERKKIAAAFQESLLFEQLISNLSARFIHLPVEQLDSEIELALQRVLNFFQVDRCGLLRTLPGKERWIITHAAIADDVPSVAVQTELPAAIFPWTYDKMSRTREAVAFSRLDDLPAEAHVDKETYRAWGIRSNLSIPILNNEAVDHFIVLNAVKSEHVWPDTLIPRLQLLGEVFVNALERRSAELALLAEIGRLKARVEDENIYLREEIKRGEGFEKIVGQSDVLKYVLFRAAQVASTDATVLILGETGTGKGMVARAIHEMSPRKHKQMITVNCAALPANLIESELFGREKGAFTGAHARQIGRFEIANGGTIFLDEIGEMPLELQAKLLRVLQDGEFERLGSPNIIKVDVRVIGATSRDLREDIKKGRFREDLYYRLNIFLVSIPPLRARVEDIPQLVNHFVEKYARKYGKRFETVPKSTLHVLQQYTWHGNVRELENVIMRAIITSPGPVLQLADRLEPENVGAGEEQLKDLESMEREHILRVLAKTRWKVDGEGGASSILGMNPSTLRFRIKKLGIQRP